MNSLRKWLYKPKKTDQSLLAQFFYADEDLNCVASELDSFDGRKDPDRCTALVNHLRQCQDKVLNICQLIMDEVIPEDRAPRDFRAKFPDDVLQENLAGQLWFGAECLAAGSSILNREQESTTMRPLAKALTKSLENVRNLLREQCFRNPPEFTEKICESLKILDRLFAEFELSYVSAMVPVKTVHEYEAQQAITVLFSETLQRALNLGLLSQDQVDSCDPALMFTIPRLAMVAGLLIFPDGPLCLDHGELSDMFRPFRSLLLKIRELLWTLSRPELSALERALCSVEEPSLEPSELDDCTKAKSSPETLNNNPQRSYYGVNLPVSQSMSNGSVEVESPGVPQVPLSGPSAIQDYLDQLYKDFPQCKEFISDLCHSSSNHESQGHESSGGGDSNESSNEMTLSQYSINLSEGGNGGVANRHQLDLQVIVNAMVPGYCVEDNSSTNSSVLDCISQRMSLNNFCDGEDGESEDKGKRRTTRGGQNELDSLSSTGDSLVVPPPHGEQNHFEDFQTTSDFQATRPTDFIGLTKSHSYSSYDDDLPTPVVEIRAEGAVLVESNTKIHSSSSSHDSGLSSISDVSQSVINSSPAKISTVTAAEVDEDESPQSCFQFLTSQGSTSQSQSQNKSSMNAKTNSRDNNNTSFSGSPPTTLVGNAISSTALNLMNLHQQQGSDYPDFHVGPGHGHQRHRIRPQGQEVTSYAVSFCNSECSTSFGDESVCETSSFDSECQDDIEIALAMQAAEIATRNEARSRFKNSADLIHRLFICISGVSDQLQTNYAADLRSTLKCVFAMNATPCEESPSCSGSSSMEQDVTPEPSLDEDLQNSMLDDTYQVETSQSTEVIPPPSWVPDQLAPQCMACLATFTVVRRRHHCRNCGKVFCGKCSGNSVSLPRYGHLKPVRVCNRCFLYCVTPFTLPASQES